MYYCYTILNLQEANQVDLDLVLINDKTEVPVCKIIDYNKYRFDQEKKAKDLKRKQQVASLEGSEINRFILIVLPD